MRFIKSPCGSLPLSDNIVKLWSSVERMRVMFTLMMTMIIKQVWRCRWVSFIWWVWTCRLVRLKRCTSGVTFAVPSSHQVVCCGFLLANDYIKFRCVPADWLTVLNNIHTKPSQHLWVWFNGNDSQNVQYNIFVQHIQRELYRHIAQQ